MIIARITRGATAERVRVTPATLILDAKRAIGMGGGTNSAYGPQMNERLREYARGRSVAPGDLPPPSNDAQWRNAPVLPAYLVKLLVWAAYADGLPLAAVTIESAQSVPRWGVAATGARSPAQRETTTPDAIPEVRVEVPGGPTVRVEVPGGPTVRVENRQSETTTTTTTRTTTPSETRTEETQPTQTGADACAAVMPGAWHLRERASASSSGREYPAGTRVVILGAQPDVTRGPAEQFFRVRVESDGREGFAFLPTSALPPCAPGAVVRGELGRAMGEATRSALVTAVKVIAGAAVVTGVAALGFVVRARLRQRRAALPPTAPLPLASRVQATRSEGSPMPPPPGLVGPQTIPQVRPQRARRVAV